MSTLGIYVQIPFCASKCSFCNFTSKVAHRDAYWSYARAICKEIESLSAAYEPAGIDPGLLELDVDTVYFGGGTPTVLGIERLQGIVTSLRRHFQFAGDGEFTLEVTPGSADAAFLAQLQRLGVNRLSVGAQSFADAELRAAGRLHSAAETRRLVELARLQGFTNISLDLIAGLPYQTEQSWEASMQAALDLSPQHISVYLFEIDEKSRLGREVLQGGNRYHAKSVPDDGFMAGAYERARHLLRREGYAQYEISNFSLPGFESVHNRKYWRMEPYVGLGAGAHSFDLRCRWQNEADVGKYGARLARGESPIVDRRRLSPAGQIEEFFFLGLRQLGGVRLADACDRWGRARIEPWAKKILRLEKDGWVEKAGDRVRLAERALLVSNEIFQEFIAA
jgi:putative oxygen-independent coproporphyrinogen III oxidase